MYIVKYISFLIRCEVRGFVGGEGGTPPLELFFREQQQKGLCGGDGSSFRFALFVVVLCFHCLCLGAEKWRKFKEMRELSHTF